ncbi:hypothetical protein CORC01_14446 [Colletotrichum orchidophilum]|uniref:Uncharacterized protein n=1 Tax=Colletotrichum orchidophilum TaxID=1209926 RepID=A0A1G4AM63_9PEZI|nr:uncharacterized protein CORC01_14446 [Colletotrichum orchidophilum]OHE90259.1 hypothetical protein CORC01_14446 [Colletotrichum orchidophilum]
MHSYRGRGGPRQSTPANVQCQKCLKRDKSTSKPYVANVELTLINVITLMSARSRLRPDHMCLGRPELNSCATRSSYPN